MEASFAGSLSSTISNMSSAHITQQLRQVVASEWQLRTMTTKFLSIQESLDVIHNRNWANTQDTTLQKLNQWLKKVDDLIFYVEDTINECLSQDACCNNNNSFFLQPPCRMYLKIRNILSLLKNIESGLEQVVSSSDPATAVVETTTALPFIFDPRNNPELFKGRENDENDIIQFLSNRGADTHTSITIAIFGMAGIGKTTLAHRVYTNERITRHFDEKFWVPVGDENFNATQIFTVMLQSLPRLTQNLVEHEALKKELSKTLKGKKTLIVLDDVWVVNHIQLNKLYALQSGGGKISILLTTRRIEAAKSIKGTKIHLLLRLSDEESWSLFKSIASRARDTPIEEGSDLEAACERIAKQCYGVPRVICKMAESSANIADVRDWEKMVVETKLWDWISSELSLKLSSMPKDLRRCFAYCSIFPKNKTIEKLDLIRLWLAQGFLYDEDIAEKSFNILLDKSLLQVCRQDEDGNVLDCTMLDLAYDLSVHLSRHDHMLVIADADQAIPPSSLSDVRHLLILSSNNSMNEALRLRSPPPVSKLRTIYSMVMRQVPQNLLSQASSLYVLKLNGLDLVEVPRDVGKLKYLRYLDLSNNEGIKHLPESITKLYLLQTLRLIGCKGLLPLSEGMINFIDQLSLVELPPHLHEKTAYSGLRNLPPVNLTAEGVANELCDLGRRANLAGPLCISGLEYVKDKEAAQKARISSKNSLSALVLCWNRSEPPSESENAENVLDGLRPHPNIRRLELSNYESQQLPMWLMRPMKGTDDERLYSLMRIHLVNCNRCLNIPSMGELPCLWELIIDGMDNVENIGQEFYYDVDASEEQNVQKVFFSGLTRLELRNLARLTEWQPAFTSQMVHTFPKLETLKVVSCPNLISMPTDFQSIKNLMIQEVPGVYLKESNWVTSIITNSSTKHTLTSLVLYMVSGLYSLPLELFQCTSLEELKLQKCEDLRAWPPNPWNPISLKELYIDRCSALTDSPDNNKLATMRSLNTLVIRGCGKLRKAPKNLRICASLKKLAISNCSEFTSLRDLQVPDSLEELDILDCENVQPLPQRLGHLMNLRIMRIGGLAANEFNSFPEHTLVPNLEILWLKGTLKMESLPDQLSHFSQLKVLRIKSFPSLKTLPDWICDSLVNLENLILEECNRVSQLPSRQKLMQLRRLRCLRIEKCINLRHLYDENGPNWTDICHIQHIKFDDRWLPRNISSLVQDQNLRRRLRNPQPDEHEQEYQDARGPDYIPINMSKYFVIAFCLINFVINSASIYCIFYYNQH